jgi:hypothetical protein
MGFDLISKSCEYMTNIQTPGMPDSPFRITKMTIRVSSNCIERTKLVYILARALGLPDEHTRPDRDKFLTVHWDNIDGLSI